MESEAVEQKETETCSVCGKLLGNSEGFVSSTGAAVCSEGCRNEFMESYAPKPKLTVYSRVTGYCTPVSSWNKGKIKEFHDRKKYGF